MKCLRLLLALAVAAVLWAVPGQAAPRVFRLASYNLENYRDEPAETRPAKTREAKEKILETIRAIDPDVLALQEVGSREALEGLRQSLARQGISYAHSEFVSGWDTNVHVAVLSKFPFSARRPHTNDSYLLSGRRFRVSRGFAELEIKPGPGYSFTLFVAHLKSKRVTAEADESEMRLQEARLLREKVEARLQANPKANIVVAGDLNDTKDSPSTRLLIGRGAGKLVDTRPAERNGDNAPSPNPAWEPRTVTWTHYYGKEDSYSRIDYILLSPGMAREWRPQDSYLPTIPNWGVGSDHRPVVVSIAAEDA